MNSDLVINTKRLIKHYFESYYIHIFEILNDEVLHVLIKSGGYTCSLRCRTYFALKYNPVADTRFAVCCSDEYIYMLSAGYSSYHLQPHCFRVDCAEG